MLKNISIAALTALLLSGCHSVKPDLMIYVSPHGSDKNDGTKEHPFATIACARNAVREAKKAGALSNGVEVVIAGGRYALSEKLNFDSQDSGITGGAIVYRAADGAQVSITGSRKIPLSSFKAVKDAAVIKRMDLAAQTHVLVADLNSLGFAKISKPALRFRPPFNIAELFVDGERMTLACWPNQGWATIKKIISGGTMRNTGSVSDSADPNKKRTAEKKGGIFTYEGDRPSRWSVDKGLWLHGFWCFDWYDEALQVESIDLVKKEIKLKVPHQYGVRYGNPSPRRWRAVNLLEELDSAGEYYIDPDKNTLLFWPKRTLPSESCIALTSLKSSLVEMKSVNNMEWRGITFEEGFYEGLGIKNCENIRIEGCTFRNFRKKAAFVYGGKNNTFASCHIHDTGAGGLHIGGGDRKTLKPGGNRVENCHIHDFSIHQLTYSSGIHLSGVGNTAAHNLLEGAPHMAVGISGNDHIFEYNIVRNVCVSSDDAAALYKGRNPSSRGNIIRYNLWKNIGSPRGHGNAAIYFDDGDGGEMVYGNIFYRCGDPGKGSFGTVFSHGGHDNVAENNIFIECKRALGSSPWNHKRWSSFIKAPLWQNRLLKEVDITSDVYVKHYPALKGFMDPQEGDKRVNYARRNVFVRCNEVYKRAWEVDKSNYTTDEDPGFVDFEAGDFNLRKDSVIYKLMPDFEPIPLDKIGPQRL